MADLRQHISLNKLDVQKPRYKRPAVVRPPERNNTQHGKKLSEGFRQIRLEYEQTLEKSPPVIEPVLVFRLKTEGKVDQDNLRRSGLTFLDEEDNSRIVVLSEDRLQELEKRTEEYSQDVPAEGRKPRYNWLSTFTGVMENRLPEDRTGRKLAREVIEPDKEYRFDIELWSVPDNDENDQRIQKLGNYVNQHDGQMLDTYVGRSLTIARVRLLGEFLDHLLHEPIVRLIDLPPQPDVGVFQLLRTPFEAFNHPIPSPPGDAPGICVIDSGITSAHPMLRNAMGYSQAFPNTLGSAFDEHGHGTLVAGVALYGDVKQCVESLSFEPSFYLFGARVLDEKNHFDDDHLIVSQMRDAIMYFQREYNCRIFNISIGDPDLVYDDGKPSAWAHILDTLARDLDIIIVVSAGNVPVVGLTNDAADHLFQSYPHYLLNGDKEDTRIIEPATAANVITVGSLAHSDHSYYISRNPDDVDIQPIAHIDYPSPFTRCGPGVNNAIKPDVCEYGGNVLWWGRQHTIRHDPGLSIMSTNINFRESLFATQIGTSLAAPKVAHLAAKILRNYPNISANLVRALIANAAIIPDAALNLFECEEDLLKVYGYGKPESDRALYSNDNCVTLIAEEKIPLDGIHLYEIPIPEEFQQLNGTRQISVSLAYDPPVRNTRADYLGVKLGFRLFRGIEIEQIVDWFAEREKDSDPDKIENRYNCTMYPSSTRRETSTLQKAIFQASQNRSFLEYPNSSNNFYLLIICQAGWASPEEFDVQRYGLAVTIEHKDAPIQLYELVSQRIQSRERIRVRS